MNRENLDFLYKMFPYHDLNSLDIIIVNQTTKDVLLTSDVATVQVINSFEKGLSKSRNVALKAATKDWCLIADDDVLYLKDFEKKILKGIQMFKNSGIIVFQSQIDENNLSKKYPSCSQKEMNLLRKFNVGSIEMLLHKKVIDNSIQFNENFGLGSNVFNCGEEQVLMHDIAQLLKLKISFYKATIVQHAWLSTGREYAKKGRYFTAGAIYAKTSPKYYVKWICIQLFFDLKQGNIASKDVYKKYKEALQGKQKLRALENETN